MSHLELFQEVVAFLLLGAVMYVVAVLVFIL